MLLKIFCFDSQLVVRGLPHLCKYLGTPEEARRFVSINPEDDLKANNNPRDSHESNFNERVPDHLASTMYQPRQQPDNGVSGVASALAANLLANQAAGASSAASSMHQQLQQANLASLGPVFQLLTAGAKNGGAANNLSESLALASLATQLQRAQSPNLGLSAIGSGIDNSSLALLAALRSTQR